MLRDKSSSAIVAVSDIARARTFYETVLGLEVVDDSMGEVLVFRTGQTHLVIYRSDEAGGNRGNAVVWDVGDDVEAIVATLKANGAAFEHYPEIGKLEGDIHLAGDMKLVWLKDPDGNLLHLNSM